MTLPAVKTSAGVVALVIYMIKIQNDIQQMERIEQFAFVRLVAHVY